MHVASAAGHHNGCANVSRESPRVLVWLPPLGGHLLHVVSAAIRIRSRFRARIIRVRHVPDYQMARSYVLSADIFRIILGVVSGGVDRRWKQGCKR